MIDQNTLNATLLKFRDCYPAAPLDRESVAALLEAYEAARVSVPVGERVDAAIEVAVRFGGIDGAHHKTWVIDQMVRHLAGNGYAALVADAKAGEDGPDTYGWDEGIAP